MLFLRLFRFVVVAYLLPFATSALVAQTVATPTFSPAPGPRVNSPTVTLTTSTSGATIRYTLDGSTPSATNGQVYTAPLLLNGANNTLRAIAIRAGFTDSAVREGFYPVLNNGGFSLPKPTDRGRIQVATIPDPLGTSLLGGLGNTFANLPLKVLRTDSGQPLRGSSPNVYRIIENGVASPNPSRPPTQSWVNRLVADRLNSVRITFWDAYDQVAGWGITGVNNVDFNNPAQVEVMLARFERWADLLSDSGLYMAVNYHNKFQSPTNEPHATAFWTVMARYFRNRTHVIYEITNEPNGTNWKSFDISGGAERKRQMRITKAIRDIDPNVFLLVLTPAGYSGGYQFASDLDPNIAVRNFANDYLATFGTPIDWTKTGVGYHNYYDPNGTSGLIRALHREFPAFWTETGLGPEVRNAINNSGIEWLSDLEFGPTLDGDRSNIQTAEKLGIGWWQWTSDSEQRQNTLWPFIQADAVAHNYWWPADTGIPSPPAITSAVSASALLGQSFVYQIVATNAANAYAASNLPPGLTLNASTGLISGTPTEAGARLVTLTAFNALGSGTASLTLSVSTSEPLHTQNFDVGETNSWFAYSGDGGVTHTLTNQANGPANSPALNLTVTVAAPPATYWYAGTGIDIATTPPFTASALSETFLSVDVRPGTSSAAEIVLVLKTPAPNEGTLSRTFTVPGGVWTTLTAPLSSFAATNFHYAATSYEIMVQKGNSGWPLASSSLRVDNVALTRPAVLPARPLINSATTLSTARGASFTYTLTATNAPTSFAASGLPAGLAINPATGVISGTPTTTGVSTVALSATNALGTGNATLLLTVTPPAPAITSALAATTLQGAPFSYTITATEAPTSFGATGLPAGLSLAPSTGILSGTPTSSGVSSVTISATNSAGSGSATLTLTVTPPTPVITSALTATGNQASPFSYTITATGSPTSFGATGLPAGLSLDASTGVISGTPTTQGTSSIHLSATNVTGTATATLSLTVGAPSVLIFADPLTSNVNFWGLATWHNAGGTLTFANGHLSFNSANTPYVATYGPSGVFPWDPGYAPFPSFSPLFAANRTLQITFEAKVSAPNGTSGLIFEAATNFAPDHYYQGFAAPVTNAWATYTVTALAPIGTPVPANITTLAFTTGGANLGIVDVRNLRIEAPLVLPPAPVITSSTTTSVAYGSPFSYTITASNSPTSFSASGLTAGLSLNTSTGVISGTPATHGVSQITLGATNAGGTGQATLSLTVTLSALQQWRVTYFGSPDPIGFAAPEADHDGDGLSNLLEYALGSDPTDPASSPAPVPGLTPSLPHSLSLTFLRARADVTYEVLATSDLADSASWQVIATNPGTVSDTTPVTVNDPEPVSTNPRRFLRLRVSQ